MATNLVSLVMQFLTPDVIARIASALGLDRDAVQKTIGGAVPALLSGLAGVAESPGGARQLSNVLAQQQPGMLDSLKTIIGGSGQKAFVDTGSSMLSGLLGGSMLGALTQSVAKFAGVGEGSTKSLLGMLGPVVMGALGQHQRNAGLDSSGLASLLASQKDQIAAAIPSSLSDQLSAAGVMDRLQGGLRSGTAAASAAASRMSEGTAAGVSHVGSAARAAAADVGRSTTASQWPYWAVALIALAALAGYFLSNYGGERVAQVPAPTTTQPETTGVGTPNLTVNGVDLANQVNTSVGALKTALPRITDAASAQATLPEIRDATARLDQVGALSGQLPADSKSALARMITASMPMINELCDKVLAIPGAGDIARPAIDELRGKLDTLARA